MKIISKTNNIDIKVKKEKFLSYCTTCMNRLWQLKQTLPYNLDQLNDDEEICLVNYNSQDGLDEWIKDNFMDYINKGKLVYFYTKEPEYFKHSHAKNIAHVNSKGDILVNIDCDNFISENFLKRICSLFDIHSNNYVHGLKGIGLGGRITISRENFYNVGGYDERMISGWGYEDPQLLQRCREMGFEVIKEKIKSEKCFKQNNKERGENCLIKRIKESDKLHRNLKGELSKSFGKGEVKIFKRCK